MMTGIRNPLWDKEFLTRLDENRHKEIWAKIVSLDINEQPLEAIEGKIVNGGSINIDGASSVRRTCSLQMVAEKININSYYWGLKTKFKLFIGVTNNIDTENYDNIIWFPQGIYIISSFSTSQTTNNYIISIQGKDKMCMLNGELGGSMTEPTDFGKYDEQTRDNDGNIVVKQRLMPIKDIIVNAVHQYAKEPLHKILVNDLPDYGIQLLEYNSDNPIWVFIDRKTNQVLNTTLDPLKIVYPIKFTDKDVAMRDEEQDPVRLVDLAGKQLNNLSEGFYTGALNQNGEAIQYYSLYTTPYPPYISIAKIERGQTAGYRLTPLTYPEDLILKTGEALTLLFDKIVKMLGEFEYFYDEEGNFVFQHKPIYIQTTWNQAKGVVVDIEDSKYSYEFGKSKLITSFNNNPNLTNVKNDYSIWGTRSGISGAEIPIHLRYALDYKPFYYCNMNNEIYYTKDFLKKGLSFKEEDKNKIKEQRDWRELIYQMAIDYRKNASNNPDFLYDIDMNNRVLNGREEIVLYPSGRTGYEQYYIDIEGFWRQLYDPTYTIEWTHRIEPTVEVGDYLVGPLPKRASEIKVDTFKPIKNKNNMSKYNPEDIVIIEKYSKEDGYENWENKLNIKPFINETTCKVDDSIITEKVEFCNANGTKTYSVEEAKEKGYNEIYVKETKDEKEIITYWPEYVYKHWSKDVYSSGENGLIWGFYIMPRALSEKDRQLVTIQELIKATDEHMAFLRKLYVYKRTENIKGETSSYNVYHKYLYTKVSGDDPFERKTLVEYFTKNDQYNIETEDEDKKYWNKDVYENPHNLNFWFDFMEDMGTISKYSVSAIGQRSKVVNDSRAKAIYFRETPTVIFEPSLNEKEEYPEWITVTESEKQNGYTYIKVPSSLLSSFVVSSQGKTAHTALEESIYTNSYCSESVSLNSVPIYYLKPNTVIYIRDYDSKINGEYIINQLTIPLMYNGTMSISATKVPERIY